MNVLCAMCCKISSVFVVYCVVCLVEQLHKLRDSSSYYDYVTVAHSRLLPYIRLNAWHEQSLCRLTAHGDARIFVRLYEYYRTFGTRRVVEAALKDQRGACIILHAFSKLFGSWLCMKWCERVLFALICSIYVQFFLCICLVKRSLLGGPGLISGHCTSLKFVLILSL